MNIRIIPFCTEFRKSPSEPFILFKKYDTYDHDHHGHNEDQRICPDLIKFRHIFKIHPVPACNQSQRHENAGNDRKKCEIPILLLINFRLAEFPELDRKIHEREKHFQKSLYPLGNKVKIAFIFILEEMVLIFLELLAHINELRVVDLQISEVVADLRDLLEVPPYSRPVSGPQARPECGHSPPASSCHRR